MLASFAKFSSSTIFMLLFTMLLAMGSSVSKFYALYKGSRFHLIVVQVRQLCEEN